MLQRLTPWKTPHDNVSGYHKDYALALKFPGPAINNIILIISSFFSSGVPEMAKFLDQSFNTGPVGRVVYSKIYRIPQ